MEDFMCLKDERGPLAARVHQFLVEQAAHLREGRIEAVARAFAVPLVVSLRSMEPGFVVVPSRRAIERFFRLKHEGLEAAGISYLRVRTAETQARGPDRMTVLAEWYYTAADGSPAGQTTVRYFLQRRHGAISVEMVEFERVAFPALADWVRAVGTQAPQGHRIH